jgi:hypothetical protein
MEGVLGVCLGSCDRDPSIPFSKTVNTNGILI